MRSPRTLKLCRTGGWRLASRAMLEAGRAPMAAPSRASCAAWARGALARHGLLQRLIARE